MEPGASALAKDEVTAEGLLALLSTIDVAQVSIHSALDEGFGIDLVSGLGKKSVWFSLVGVIRSLRNGKLTLVTSELASVVSLILTVGAESQSLVANLAAAVLNVQVVNGRVLGVVTDCR